MGEHLLAVGFDLDYTLWDQSPFAGSFFDAIAGELAGRLGCPEPQVAAAFHGAMGQLTLRHPQLFDAALRRLGAWDAALVAELVDRYHRHRPSALAYPGAEETLWHLAGRGYLLFLVTDGFSGTQRHKVEALGISPCFHHMIFTGDLPPEARKPSPIPFQLACAHLGVAPARSAYVADNPLCDFAGPRQLGMLTIGVSTGPFAALAVPAEQGPHLRIGTVQDLQGLL